MFFISCSRYSTYQADICRILKCHSHSSISIKFSIVCENLSPSLTSLFISALNLNLMLLGY